MRESGKGPQRSSQAGDGGPVRKMRHFGFFPLSAISGSSDLEPEFMGSNFRFTSCMELFPPWYLLIYPTGLLPERES